jgi:tetratricopeptide (TPR) repeat protein
MNRLLIIALISLISACAGQSHRPVPVEERGIGVAEPQLAPPGDAPSPPSDPQLSLTPALETLPSGSQSIAPAPALTRPPPQQRSYAGPSPALLALMEQADQHETQGQFDAALAQLERAQRIAPRDPLVYLQLSRLRLRMGELDRAEQLARRGLSLSGQDPELVSAFNALLHKLQP